MIYYLRDSNSKLIGLKYNNNLYYYLKNIQDDIIGLLDSNYNLVAQYLYDSWGNIISIKDNLGNEITDTSNIAHINPYRYRSYYYDKDTKLYYLNSRYYNPAWGRFINADGIINADEVINGFNLYAYTTNNPITKIDFNGKASVFSAIKKLSNGFKGIAKGALVQNSTSNSTSNKSANSIVSSNSSHIKRKETSTTAPFKYGGAISFNKSSENTVYSTNDTQSLITVYSKTYNDGDAEIGATFENDFIIFGGNINSNDMSINAGLKFGNINNISGSLGFSNSNLSFFIEGSVNTTTPGFTNSTSIKLEISIFSVFVAIALCYVSVPAAVAYTALAIAK